MAPENTPTPATHSVPDNDHPTANHPTPSPVQQARSSITTLSSLFDDPITLKPRRKDDSQKDDSQKDDSQNDSQVKEDVTPAEVDAAALTVPQDDDKPAEGGDDALANALLTTGPRPGSKASLEVSDRQKIARALKDAEATSPSAASQPSSATAAHSPDPSATKTEDSKAETSTSTTTPEQPTLAPDQQVRIKRNSDHLLLIFPPEQASANPEVTLDFVDSELWQQLQQRLSGGERSWKPGTPVHLDAQNHLIDGRQLQELGEALDRFDLKLTRIATRRRQTAVAAASNGLSVDQGDNRPAPLLSDPPPEEPAAITAEPLYLQTTVRSGAEIRHPGSVIIMGDLNPGSSVVADGDILIWGRLRGVAHAGASGNRGSIILALKLEPTQLRIADALARVPATAQAPILPEVAYVTAKGDIRITEAAGFTRPYR